MYSKKTTHLILLSVIATILSVSSALAQEFSYFDNPIILDEKSGLDGEKVSAVVLDTSDILWIGTTTGLYKYDGLSYKKYENVPGDSSTLISNNIRHLFFDETKNQLWISTWEVACGLSVLDLETDIFTNYYYDETKPGGITGAGLFWSYRDKFGHYWVSTRGLARYEETADTFRSIQYKLQASDINVKSGEINKMISFTPDQFNDSILWIGTQSGLLRFNVVTENFKRFPIASFNENGFTIRTLHHHSDNKIYIGTWAAGMHCFDKEKETFQSLSIDSNADKVVGGAYQRIIRIFPKDSKGLWVSTFEGLVEYDTENGKAKRFFEGELDRQLIYRVNYIDKENRIYAWNNQGDDSNTPIYIFSPLRQQLKVYPIEPNLGRPVFPRRILQDEDSDKLWVIAPNSMGLYQLDLKNGRWKNFPPPQSYMRNENASFQGWDLLKTHSGKLLVLTTATIYEFSNAQQKLIPWNLQPDRALKVGFHRIIQAKDSTIWIGSVKKGLYSVNPNTGLVMNYDEEMTDLEKLGSGSILDLQEDRNGNIWIRSTGYSVYNPQRDTFYNFAYFFPNEKVIRHIQSLGIDKNGNTWISSTSNGIVNAIGVTDADHPEHGVQAHFNMREHFKTDKVEEFFLDQQKNLWLISDHLEKIETDGTSQVFYSTELLNNKSFTQAIPLSDGRVAIGFAGGIGLFNPNEIQNKTAPLEPYVQAIHVFDQQIDLSQNTNSTKQLTFQPSENFLEIAYSCANPSFFGTIEFQYQMQGLDKEWITSRDQRFINYTALPSGQYTFQLRARKAGEDWSPNIYKLNIEILSPWYATWWAFVLYFILLSAMAYAIYQFLLSRKIAQQEALRLKELDTFKTKFYDNITHEFRTPLTVIQGMATEIEEQPNEALSKKLSLIKSNSKNLLDLVNQMLDLSKLKAEGLQLDWSQRDIISYLSYIVESYESFARSRGLSLQFYSEEKELFMDVDEQKLERILLNLLSNAIKFTPEQGKVLVVAKKIKTSKGDQFQLLVRDSGVGISEKELPSIFDRFHQGINNNENQGTGIGLSLVQELVELLGGTIQVESKLQKGTDFFVNLPITRKAAKHQEQAKRSKVLPVKKMDTPESFDEKDDRPFLLMVEDNADVAYYINNCLKADYQVIQCRNGQEGLEKAYELIPDIIISDVMMPEMDGFTLCKKLKTDIRTNHIPIILLTAKATAEDKLVGLQYGADAYLTKPFDKEELLTRLQKLLEIRKVLQAKYSAPNYGDQRTNTDIPMDIGIVSEASANNKDIFLQKADEIILKYLDDETLSSAVLANQLHLSTSQVYRKIKALTGMSTAIYIRYIRLQKAQHLLITENLSISEIAYQTGFRSPVYFSQAFKETFGESPSAFRSEK